MARTTAKIAIVQLTLRFRVKDKHARELNRQAGAVNFVWNYCNETQRKAARTGRIWLDAFALQKLTSGACIDLDLHAHTVQRVCSTYARSRSSRNRPWLRFRGKKSLGWIPFNTGHVAFRDCAFVFRKKRYDVWLSRGVAGLKLGAGSFSRDASGRWYLNVSAEFDSVAVANNVAVGLDLGLKSLAVLSSGEKIAAPSMYRRSEQALALAQRSRKTKRARAIHRKIANRRRDFLHNTTSSLAKRFALIFVGDVAASRLVRTRFAKSVHDAAWADLKRMLSYKTMRYGGRLIEIAEIYTSQTCSSCDSRESRTRPQGIAGLGIREWTCDFCGTRHDRDANAALNILRLGLKSLAGGAAA